MKYRGGIRGIVELEILRQIEGKLNGISIKSFFDLVVGTR
jgi:patatin-like phospholipase/acyl hydrolase